MGHIFGPLGLATKQEKTASAEPSQLLKVAKAVGSSYAQTYGPLTHGDLNGFLHNLYAHPLGPILDAATLVTGGAGAAAKVGGALEKAGAISDASRLARLGKASDITVPGFTEQAVGRQAAEDVGQADRLIVKQSSRNPAIRGRQQLVNVGLNKLPAQTPVLGAAARATKILKANTGLDSERLIGKLLPHSAAYGKLNLDEQAAFHLVANGIRPEDYAAFLRTEAAKGEHAVSQGTLKVLDNPKVQSLADDMREAPDGTIVSASGENGKLADALNKGRAASDALGAAKVKLGLIDDTTNAERPYFAARMLNGATHEAATTSDALRGELGSIERDYQNLVTQAMGGKPGDYKAVTALQNGRLRAAGHATVTDQLRAIAERDLLATMRAHPDDPAVQVWTAKLARADAIQAELAKRAHAALEGEPHVGSGGPGLIDQPGREIPVIAKELADEGRPQPFYLPMRAEANPGTRQAMRVSTKATIVPAPTTKRITGTLLQHGLTSFHDSLTPEFMRTVRYGRRADLHDALMEHAVRLAPGEALPQGWTFLKVKAGEHIPYTEQVRGAFEHQLKENEPFDFKNLFTSKTETPAIASDVAGGRLIVPEHAANALADEIRTHSWLSRNLYQRPTSLWKHLVLGLRPGFAVNITVGNHVLALAQAPSLVRFVTAYLNQLPGHTFEKLLGAKIDAATMEDLFPEQAHGAFGTQEGMQMPTARFSGKAGRVAHNLYQGVMPPTIAVENFLRRAMVESWARDTPEVRDVLRSNGGDINAAIRKVVAARPDIRNEISRRVDDALGNYRSYSAPERAIKSLIPFYGWSRHATKSGIRILSEHPIRVNAARQIGEVGHHEQGNELGPLPSYMGGDVALPGLPSFLGPLNGRTPVLDTHALNPLNTLVDLAEIPSALSRKAGTGSDTLSSGLNPIVQALIEQMTGKSLLSGAPIKGNALANAAENAVPQEAIIAQLLGHGAPTKPTSLYQNDLATRLANLLGVPVKKVDLGTAHLYAAKDY